MQTDDRAWNVRSVLTAQHTIGFRHFLKFCSGTFNIIRILVGVILQGEFFVCLHRSWCITSQLKWNLSFTNLLQLLVPRRAFHAENAVVILHKMHLSRKVELHGC